MGEYPTRESPARKIAAVVLIAVIATAGIIIISMPPAGDHPRLIVYTYDSFLAWGEDPSGIDELAFGPFEDEFGAEVQIERLHTDAKGIVTRLGTEQSNPVADVVVGIDNVLILQPGVTDLLEPFQPPNLDFVNQSIIDGLDPDHYITPFDFGLVTLIYNTSRISTDSYPELLNLTLEDLSSLELSSSFVTENPNLSSPGLAFLLTTIAIRNKLQQEDWRDWWEEVKEDINVQSGWSEAWGVWSTDPTKSLLNSYSTDPAYSAFWSQAEPDTAVAPLCHNNTKYAWMQIEGMGIVKNGPNPELAELFIEYCLNSTVQSLIATNQWMLPVRNGVNLVPAFQYALRPDDVVTLNHLLSRVEIAANLTSWLSDYDSIMTT
ncbi:MAG: thiamine ABC transporter substrate-binding protein [Candidatus Thorarchaeota archaeon]|nr:thiamine ABC transporter substrate-binding protein [Candidatus Thorarchaeota archaeon]